MIYHQGDLLQPRKRYVASFQGGNLISGSNAAEVKKWEQGIPWITASVWTDSTSGSPYADWNFICAQPIDAGVLGITLEQVVQTFDPAGDWSFVQLADQGEGLSSKGGACSFSNLSACFNDAKSLLIWGTVALLLVVFLASGGPSLIRGATGR